jgi:hypothetical protein
MDSSACSAQAREYDQYFFASDGIAHTSTPHQTPSIITNFTTRRFASEH